MTWHVKVWPLRLVTCVCIFIACSLSTRITLALRYSPHNSIERIIYSSTIKKGTWKGIIDILTILRARRSACGFPEIPRDFFFNPKCTDQLCGPQNLLFKGCHSRPSSTGVKDVCLHGPVGDNFNCTVPQRQISAEGGTFLTHLNRAAASTFWSFNLLAPEFYI
jgi:hypothetical protein